MPTAVFLRTFSSLSFKRRKPLEPGASPSRGEVSDSRPSGSGTGFFITTDGFLVTNEHVIKGAAQIRLITHAGIIEAKVVKADVANDLALLKATGRFAPLPVSASRSARLGNTVATVGLHVGLAWFNMRVAGWLSNGWNKVTK
jgi:serine protease Do